MGHPGSRGRDRAANPMGDTSARQPIYAIRPGASRTERQGGDSSSMKEYPRNKRELLNNLRLIARDTKSDSTRDISIALAYIINELVPDDRTTKRVFN